MKFAANCLLLSLATALALMPSGRCTSVFLGSHCCCSKPLPKAQGCCPACRARTEKAQAYSLRCLLDPEPCCPVSPKDLSAPDAVAHASQALSVDGAPLWFEVVAIDGAVFAPDRNLERPPDLAIAGPPPNLPVYLETRRLLV